MQMNNKKSESPYNYLFQFKNSNLEKQYTIQDNAEKRKYIFCVSIIQLINSLAFMIEEQEFSIYSISYFTIIVVTNLIIKFYPIAMPFTVLIDQISSCYFTFRQMQHLENSNSSFPVTIFAVGQTIGGYLLFGSSSFLLDCIGIASSQIMLVILLATSKIYSNIILLSLIITFSFYKFLHTKNERNYFYQKHKNQQWLHIINKTIRNELIVTKLESGHLQLHDLNKKAKQLKIHENPDYFSTFLENLIVDKKKSHISIDSTQIQNTLKSYLLVRLTVLQDTESKRPSKSTIQIIDPTNKIQAALGANTSNYEAQHVNLKIGSDFINNHNSHKSEYLDSKKTLNEIKNTIRKKSESRKLNPPSIISKQFQSTRPSKVSDPKVNTMTDNQAQTINNFASQNPTSVSKQEFKDSNIPDVIYCDYIINDKIEKRYKISVSEVYTDQYLLVMSFEENNQENYRELKKQNDFLNEILIRSHIDYMHKQQNQFINLCEMNYADLKLNQYLHMNSVFALTQHMYLQKRNRLPIKVQEFNFNALIESLKQLFPQLTISKDQTLNDNNKQLIKNDQMRIKFILISILSSIFYNQTNQKQVQLESPQRNRAISCYSNCAPMVQFISPSQSTGRKQIEYITNNNVNNMSEDNKFNSKQQLIPKDTSDSLKNFDLNSKKKSKIKNTNKQLSEAEEEDSKSKKRQQDKNITKFGTPKLLHANYGDQNEELANNLSLTKEKHRRGVIDGYYKTDSNLTNGMANNQEGHPISTLNSQIKFSKSILNAISDITNGVQQQTTKKDKDNFSKVFEKMSSRKNTDEDKEIEFQYYEDTQNEVFEGEDLDDGRNTQRQNRQLREESEQSFDRYSRNQHASPSMSIKFIEKQKDYQKDCYEIKISYQPVSQLYSPTQTYQEKRVKQTIRGISATLNSMIYNISDQQQQTKTQQSNTNNSILEYELGRRQNELDQTLNEYNDQVISNRNQESNSQYFSNLNGNQDELINKIEERVLLECIKQVCQCEMEYTLEKGGFHTITFQILSDLPQSQINQIIPDKKRTVSVTSYYSNSNTNLSNNNNFAFQKEKFKNINNSTINTNQQALSQMQNLYPSQIQNNPNNNPQYLSQTQNIYKILNQKNQIKMLNNQQKQNKNSTTNSNNNQTVQYSPQSFLRKKQTSLPIVSEKILDYYQIKEDESLENNINNSNDQFKSKSRRYCKIQNSSSLTSLEVSPVKNKYLNQGVAFDKPKQVIASNSLISDNKFASPKVQQSDLTGSILPRNKAQNNTKRYTTNFKDCIQIAQQFDDSSVISIEQQTALQIESERKQNDFIEPKPFEFSMQRNKIDYH